jgi:hypothetical protein
MELGCKGSSGGGERCVDITLHISSCSGVSGRGKASVACED